MQIIVLVVMMSQQYYYSYALQEGHWTLDQEWQQRPFIYDVFVTSDGTRCGAKQQDSTELFYYSWTGLRALYWDSEWLEPSYTHVWDDYHAKTHYNNQIRSAVPLLRTGNLNGIRICGR